MQYYGLFVPLQYTGLGEALLSFEEGTMLAPTDEAFEGLLAILNTVGLNVTAIEDLPVEVVTSVRSLCTVAFICSQGSGLAVSLRSALYFHITLVSFYWSLSSVSSFNA